MNLISKKDLLLLTGISYGQLYRWKRQNLIPDDWFIKKSAYTGQETFFPRDKIISRIQTILNNKDSYSLHELSQMFKENTVYKEKNKDTIFKSDEIAGINTFIKQNISNNLTINEVVIAIELSILHDNNKLSNSQLIDIINLIKNNKDILSSTEGTISVFCINNKFHIAYVNSEDDILYDKSINKVLSISLKEAINTFMISYNNRTKKGEYNEKL